MEIFLLIVFGVISGIIGGMGLGGGTLLIPLLVIFCKLNQHVAQSINLIAFVPMCALSLIIHFKNNLVDIKSALLLGIPASILGVIGSLMALKINPDSLRLYFGIFLCLLGVFQLVTLIRKKFFSPPKSPYI